MWEIDRGSGEMRHRDLCNRISLIPKGCHSPRHTGYTDIGTKLHHPVRIGVLRMSTEERC